MYITNGLIIQIFGGNSVISDLSFLIFRRSSVRKKIIVIQKLNVSVFLACLQCPIN